MSLIRDVLAWFRDAFESGGGPRNADGRRGGSMDIKRDRMVFLGYGKYWRSDGIVGLMPIEEERGPKLRTNVFAQALREAVTDLLAAFHEFSPALRSTLQSEHHFDAEQWEQRLGETLRAPPPSEPVEQNELFD